VKAGKGRGYKDWATLRTDAIDRFGGELPHPITEQEIIDAFELHPDAVERAVDQAAHDLAAGHIRSAWGILRHRAEAILNPPSNPKAATGRDTEKRLARAEQWIRNAGLYSPGWGACKEALVEDLHLTDHQADTLRDLYEERHPAGLAAEQEAIERAQRWIESQAALKAVQQQKRDELDHAQTQQPAVGDFA